VEQNISVVEEYGTPPAAQIYAHREELTTM
jgi:hypothetical protein